MIKKDLSSRIDLVNTESSVARYKIQIKSIRILKGICARIQHAIEQNADRKSVLNTLSFCKILERKVKVPSFLYRMFLLFREI